MNVISRIIQCCYSLDKEALVSAGIKNLKLDYIYTWKINITCEHIQVKYNQLSLMLKQLLSGCL